MRMNASLFHENATITGVSGLISGITSCVLLYPLDLVRTRRQCGTLMEYSKLSNLGALRKIYLSRGIHGVYSGLTVSTLAAGASWCQYYYSLQRFRGTLKDTGLFRNRFAVDFTAGYLAAVTCQVLFSPVWVVKQQIQVSDARTSFKSVMRSVVSQDGLRGLYRGLPASMISSAHSGLQFGIMETLNALYLGRRSEKLVDHEPDRPLAISSSTSIALVSKIAALLLMSPIDVIRVHQRHKSVSIKANILDVARSIYGSDGMLGFFRGMSLSLYRVIPAQLISFSTYFYVQSVLGRAWAS